MSQIPQEPVVQGPSSQELSEAQGAPGNLIVFDLRTLARFQEERPYVQVLSDIDTARVVLFAFKAGQELKEHKTSSQILVQVLRGQVSFSATGTDVKLKAGMLIQLEANIPHSVVARTDAIMLLTMTPSPSNHSLQNELFRGIQPLVSRKS
ncbi:cupin domain-containing protein [Ktedonosporobacter rubrisoli]|uniref:Cupin domain-containing protein n=1 Tax=Ktedonosporobacter rubrisoli TaxID=2509675 RepID=A0A4P6K4I1_KTERU|nr:cupin domain-containing protein [Ktedonosporobacter rubrisoli]QBD83227.1 cupin domain-containing protein [Ktedonosporobacter rubrisoli]